MFAGSYNQSLSFQRAGRCASSIAPEVEGTLRVEIREQAFDPWQELDAYQKHALEAGSWGASAVFVGTMRDVNEGDSVASMKLEHYAGMTERHLERIAAQARERWQIDDVLLLHRIGELEPGDPIVLVGVWSAHRAAAFDACRFIMEDLKSQAPFWKKEQLPDRARWVEKNTPKEIENTTSLAGGGKDGG